MKKYFENMSFIWYPRKRITEKAHRSGLKPEKHLFISKALKNILQVFATFLSFI